MSHSAVTSTKQRVGFESVFRFLSEDRRCATRIAVDLPCVVLEAGAPNRSRVMRIRNVSRNGLLLEWDEGISRQLTEGQELLICTNVNGQAYRAQGLIARTTLSPGGQLIGVGSVTWYLSEATLNHSS